MKTLPADAENLKKSRESQVDSLRTHSFDVATGTFHIDGTDFILQHYPANVDELAKADCAIHRLVSVLDSAAADKAKIKALVDELAEAKAEIAGERNLHGQTRVVVEELNTICNDLRNAGQPQFIRSEAIRLLREDQAELRSSLAASQERVRELEEVRAAAAEYLRIHNSKGGEDYDGSLAPLVSALLKSNPAAT